MWYLQCVEIDIAVAPLGIVLILLLVDRNSYVVFCHVTVLLRADCLHESIISLSLAIYIYCCYRGKCPVYPFSTHLSICSKLTEQNSRISKHVKLKTYFGFLPDLQEKNKNTITILERIMLSIQEKLLKYTHKQQQLD